MTKKNKTIEMITVLRRIDFALCSLFGKNRFDSECGTGVDCVWEDESKFGKDVLNKYTTLNKYK